MGECFALLLKLNMFFSLSAHPNAFPNFTHKVTLPLLNCVETSSQKDLLQILPSLYHDLADGKVHTLDKHRVSFNHPPVTEPDSELLKKILYLMCVDAAYAVKLQCGSEYGFADDSELPRATQLDKLTEEELFGLPTNNLNTEKDFCKFSRLSELANFRN